MANTTKTVRYDLTASDHLSGPMGQAARALDKASASMDIASRTSRTLDRALQSQQRAAQASADGALALAKADKILEEAEHGLRDGALEAELALKRQAAAEQEAGRQAEIAAAKQEALAKSFDNAAKNAGGFDLKGAGIALSPALLPLAGGIAAGIGAIGVSFGAAALGAGLFGKAASSVLSAANQNATKLQALEQKLNTATTAAQKKAIQDQINALEAGWSKGYLQLLGNLEGFKQAWTETSQAIAVPALTTMISALTDSLGFLQTAATPVAKVFQQWGSELDQYFSSSKGSAEINRIAAAFGKFSASQLQAIGVFVVDIGKGVFALGQDVAANNINFGAFGQHLDQWGAAFLRWSQSSAARQDVDNFLAYLHANGPAVADLLKNLGGALQAFAPGLSSLGSLELKLVSDFLGFLAHTPKFIAQPLIDTAGALLLLQKTGVLSVGIKVVGAAAKWLSGGVIDFGSGAAAAAEIRAAFTTGGAAAAAEIRAAMAGGGAAAGGESAAGAAAAKTAGGTAAGLTAGFAAAGVAAAGAFLGALIRGIGDKLSPAGTFAGNINKQLQADGGLWSTGLLHSFTFGGLESWLTAKFGLPVGGFINNTLNVLSSSSAKANNQVQGDFTRTGQAADVVKAKIGQAAAVVQNNLNQALASAGTQADALRISHLGPLGSKIDSVDQQTRTMQGTVSNGAPLAAGGQHADTFRNANLTPLQSKIDAITRDTGTMQSAISNLKGKSITIQAIAAGSGGVSVTASGLAAKEIALSKLASGGRIPGYGGGDRHLALLESGEAVVDKVTTAQNAAVLKAWGVPGFAAGGVAGQLAAYPGAVGGATGGDSRDIVADDLTKEIQAMIAAIKAAQAAQAGAVSASGARTGSVAVEQAYAFSLFPRYGWGADQKAPLIALWNQESGWNPYAVNPNGGAYGIPQSLGHGHPYNLGDYQAQIQWGENYIKSIYGSPSVAWGGYWARGGWYDNGGLLMPGATLAYNGTGKPEYVTTSDDMAALIGEVRALRGELRQLTGVAAAIPASTGRHVAGAVGGAGADAAFRRRYPG